MATGEREGVGRPTPGAAVGAPAPTGAATAYARHLLVAGLVGGHVGLVASTVVFGVLGGLESAASAAVGSVIALLFFSLGQAVVLRYAERLGSGLLIAGLASYGVRVSGLAGALVVYEGAGIDVLDRTATALGLVVTVLLWTTAEVVAFAKMRMPVYDVHYNPAPGRRESDAN